MLSIIFKKSKRTIVRLFCHQSLAYPTCVQIKQIEPVFFGAAINITSKVFLEEEPLVKAIGIANNVNNFLELSSLIQRTDEGVSFKAINQNNQILGFSINGINVLEDVAHLQELSRKTKNLQISFLAYVWSLMYEESNLHKQFNCDKIFEISNLVSLPESRGLGVGRLLMKQSLEKCEQMGLKLARVDCTSAFTAKLAEKLDMKEVWCKSYKDITDPFESICLIPQPPHTHLRTFVKEF